MESFKNIIEKLKTKLRGTPAAFLAFHEKMMLRPLRYVAVISVFLVFVIEVLSRHSLVDALAFVLFTPHLFVYNCIIIGLTLTPAFLFRKKDFMLLLLSIIWLGLGVANSCVLMFRITPLGAVDIALLESVMDIFDRYLQKWQIVLVGTLVVGLIALIIRLWIKAPKHPVKYLSAAATIAVMCFVTFGATQLSLSASAIEEELGNLADAYDDYGFAYCFSASVVDRGIDRPEDYSAERVGEILSTLPEETAPEEYPDIILVQLESFFDVNYLNALELSADCIPNFRHIKDNYLSGFLTVPSIGAGTANTEFEVISGMRLYDFGTGEYPYKTVLQESACETVNTYLSSQGLTCHAIHNNFGNFYDRNNVYKALGYDTFTSLEYMQNFTYMGIRNSP